MKKLILVILIPASLLCCTKAKQSTQMVVKDSFSEIPQSKDETIDNSDSPDLSKSELKIIPEKNYLQVKQKIETKRNDLSIQYKSAVNSDIKKQTLEKATAYFTKALLNDIIPHWYGTEWDFNGHTNIPNQGAIACGYFVSTTLKHMGVQLNRYKLAQQASKLEVESIAIRAKNVIFSTNETIESTLLALHEGVYIVGLDNHVGYIYKHKKESYFIHSSYITDSVLIELAEHSGAFPSNAYYLAPVTNVDFIKKWLLKEPLYIKTI